MWLLWQCLLSGVAIDLFLPIVPSPAVEEHDTWQHVFSDRDASALSRETWTPRITYVYTLQDLSYRDRHWHDKCFKCGSCSTSLVNESFAFKNDQLYCAACYEQMFAQRCTKCKLVFRPGNTRLAVAHPPAESRHGGLNVLLNVLLLFLYFIFIYFYRNQATG